MCFYSRSSPGTDGATVRKIRSDILATRGADIPDQASRSRGCLRRVGRPIRLPFSSVGSGMGVRRSGLQWSWPIVIRPRWRHSKKSILWVRSGCAYGMYYARCDRISRLMNSNHYGSESRPWSKQKIWPHSIDSGMTSPQIHQFLKHLCNIWPYHGCLYHIHGLKLYRKIAQSILRVIQICW